MRKGETTETLAWLGAVVLTVVAAGIAVELAKWLVLLLHGTVHGLPFRVTSGLSHVTLFSVILVGPATISWVSWKWLLAHTERSSVVTAILIQLLLWFVTWPALLAYQIGQELGR